VARNSAAYEVRLESQDLIDMHLEIGQTVHFLVREDTTTDRTGRDRSHSWTFLRDISSSDQFEFAESEDPDDGVNR
jgi:hypothetical protein